MPQVGDFVARGEPLFRLYSGAVAIDDRKLRTAAVLGPERTLEQDLTFAFRILVDIAIKALSPAINDPTTAVLALDQLHRLLRMVSRICFGKLSSMGLSFRFGLSMRFLHLYIYTGGGSFLTEGT